MVPLISHVIVSTTTCCITFRIQFTKCLLIFYYLLLISSSQNSNRGNISCHFLRWLYRGKDYAQLMRLSRGVRNQFMTILSFTFNIPVFLNFFSILNIILNLQAEAETSFKFLYISSKQCNGGKLRSKLLEL